MTSKPSNELLDRARRVRSNSEVQKRMEEILERRRLEPALRMSAEEAEQMCDTYLK